MKAQELANIAESFTYTGIQTCYLKGFWGQRLTQQEYDRVLRMYPENSKYKNEKYIGTDVFPFDCICFVKGILGGCTPNRRISYQQMASNPVGDCTTETFAEKLYDLVHPGMNVPAGYGISKKGHAALSLGGGRWVDVSFDYSGQNGAMLHTGGIPGNYVCGKIPGVDYSDEPVPEPGDAEDFRNFLMKHAPETIMTLYEKWRKTNG